MHLHVRDQNKRIKKAQEKYMIGTVVPRREIKSPLSCQFSLYIIMIIEILIEIKKGGKKLIYVVMDVFF